MLFYEKYYFLEDVACQQMPSVLFINMLINVCITLVVKCGILSGIAHATIAKVRAVHCGNCYKTDVTYQCLTGYKFSINATTVTTSCTTSGIWTPITNNCTC